MTRKPLTDEEINDLRAFLNGPNIITRHYDDPDFVFDKMVQWGAKRNIAGHQNGWRFQEGRNDNGFYNHENGASLEYTTSVELGFTWNPHVGIVDTEFGDTPICQCKCTDRLVKRTDGTEYGLAVQKKAEDKNWPYVLGIVQWGYDGVLGRYQKGIILTVKIVGWLWGSEAKRPEFASTGYSNFFLVPFRKVTRPIQELKDNKDKLLELFRKNSKK